VTLTAVPAIHEVYELGYVLQTATHSVYFAGDTALHPGLASIAERFAPSVAILPVDGTHTIDAPRLVMNPADAITATRTLGSALVVPSHADARFVEPVLSWYATQIDDAAASFARQLARALPSVQCAQPSIGGRVLLPRS
jgi:L-ascorbate metabolism protein UlaG (beta-lactamase superfamily)